MARAKKEKSLNLVSRYTILGIRPNLHLVRPDLVQVPLNAFDRRILESDGWTNYILMAWRYARSAYLQGLLLITPSPCPNREPAGPFSSVVGLAGNETLDPAQACLSFLNDYRINAVVIGVDELWQLEDAIKAASQALKTCRIFLAGILNLSIQHIGRNMKILNFHD